MQNIGIDLKSSRLFIGLTIVAVLGAVVASVNLSISGEYKSILIIGTLAYGGWVLWDTGLAKGAHAIRRFQLLADGSCRLLPDGAIVKIRGDSTVTTLVCVLRFVVPGKRWPRSCIIFRDAVSQETYRQLLVWLRCAIADPN